MERKRARAPHSDSGRLIWPTVILTNHGAAANAPIANNVIPVTCRTGRLILSAIKIPKPSPIAVRVSTSSGATGSSSELFEMEMRDDIAYQYTAHPKNKNGIFELAIDTDFCK